MFKKSWIYVGIATILAALVLGSVFIASQRSPMLTNNQQSVIKEKYDTNEVCAFTIYKPVANSGLTPTPDVSKEIECSFKIHENLPLYTFQIIGEKGKNNIERIQVLQKGSSQHMQTFSGFDTYPFFKRMFETQDINFDGYLDIRTPKWYGTAGFTGYQYWVFRPETSMFELHEQLATLANPKPDPATQTITTDEAKRGTVRYKWQDGELIEI